jgi:hypothetical protein
LDFFNFSLRGTQIHPKKPAFLRPIKSFILTSGKINIQCRVLKKFLSRWRIFGSRWRLHVPEHREGEGGGAPPLSWLVGGVRVFREKYRNFSLLKVYFNPRSVLKNEST